MFRIEGRLSRGPADTQGAVRKRRRMPGVSPGWMDLWRMSCIEALFLLGSCRVKRYYSVNVKTLTLCRALVLALAATIAASAADALVLQSPNGHVRFRVALVSGRLTYDVTLAGKSVIEPSAFAILIDGVNLAEAVRAGKVEQYKTDATYATFGVHATP